MYDIAVNENELIRRCWRARLRIFNPYRIVRAFGAGDAETTAAPLVVKLLVRE